MRMSLGLDLTGNAALGARTSLPGFPWPGAAIDMNFITQRYWWGGAEKTTANFTTYTLSGSTFGANGLTPTDTINVTLSLSGLGTFVPGALAIAVVHSSAPGVAKCYGQLDDGTTAERVSINQVISTASLAIQTMDGGVSQANLNPSGGTTAIGVRHAIAGSYDTNDVKASANGIAGSNDLVGTLPTVTTLRIGKGTTANAAVGAICRIMLFSSVKTQAELDALSVALRDAA